jgi:hypothetical protein
MRKIISILLYALLVLTTPITTAQEVDLPSAGITPDSRLYGLDRALERISLALTFNKAAKAEKRLKIASERLAELKEMTIKGKTEYTDNLADEYIDNIRAANEIAAVVSKEDRAKFDQLIELKTSNHILVLDQLHENVPDQAKSAIEKARNASIKSQETPKKSQSQGLKEKSPDNNNDEFAERFNKVKELGKKEIDNIEEKSDNVLDPLSDKFAGKILEKMERGKATNKGKS